MPDTARPKPTALRRPDTLGVSVAFMRLLDMPAEIIFEMLRARREQFVDQLGWELPTGRALLEIDQFDTDDALYCLARDEAAGERRYSVRLLSRNESMVAALWPALIDRVPKGAVELSRFVVHGKARPRWNRASIPVFLAAMRDAGHRHIFGVADDRMIRVYRSVLAFAPATVRPAGRNFNLVQWEI